MQVAALTLKWLALPAAAEVAPYMPVDSQTLQLEGMELQLKVWWLSAAWQPLLSWRRCTVVQCQALPCYRPSCARLPVWQAAMPPGVYQVLEDLEHLVSCRLWDPLNWSQVCAKFWSPEAWT